MKTLTKILVLVGLLVVTGCASRGALFDWGDAPRAVAQPVYYASPTPMASPCGG